MTNCFNSQDSVLQDPIKCYERWVAQARQNTKIYIEVFTKLADTVYTEKDLHYLTEYGRKLKPKDIAKLKQICGYVVEFPLGFLKDSKIYGSITRTIDKYMV